MLVSLFLIGLIGNASADSTTIAASDGEITTGTEIEGNFEDTYYDDGDEWGATCTCYFGHYVVFEFDFYDGEYFWFEVDIRIEDSNSHDWWIEVIYYDDTDDHYVGSSEGVTRWSGFSHSTEIKKVRIGKQTIFDDYELYIDYIHGSLEVF